MRALGAWAMLRELRELPERVLSGLAHRKYVPIDAHGSWLHALFPYLLLVAVAGSFWLWNSPASQAADSLGYLTFDRTRTVAYPLFLDAVTALFGTVAVVVNIQLVLAAIALVFFGCALRHAFDAPLTALMLVAFLGNWPHLVLRHAEILTESLFISCCCVLIGFLALLLRRPSGWMAAAASLACGLAITLRPSGVTLAPLLVVALWLIWHQCAGKRWVIVAALVVPAALCVLGESALWKAHHNRPARPNLINGHLFAKALLITPAPALADAELAHATAIGREVMAPGRELVENAPSLQAKIYLLKQFEQAAQYDAYARTIFPLMQLSQQAHGQGALDVRFEGWLDAMLSEPASWLGNALMHYWGLWSSHWVFGPRFLANYRDYAENLVDSQLFADALVFFPLWPRAQASTRHLGLAIMFIEQTYRWLMFASFAASFPAIGLALWRRFRRGVADRGLALAALCGLGVHVHFLLCGFVGTAVDRYAFAMLPMAAVCGTLLTRWALREIRHLSAIRAGGRP